MLKVAQILLMSTLLASTPAIAEDDQEATNLLLISFEQSSKELTAQLRNSFKPLEQIKQTRLEIIQLHMDRFRHVADLEFVHGESDMTGAAD